VRWRTRTRRQWTRVVMREEEVRVIDGKLIRQRAPTVVQRGGGRQ
jgi:hypothetical protein